MDESFLTESASDVPGAADPFATAKQSALKAAEDLRAAAAAKAQEIRSAAEQRAAQLKASAGERAAEIRDYADKAWSGAGDQLKSFTTEAEKFAREKPLQALLAAFGAGFLFGLIIRR